MMRALDLSKVGVTINGLPNRLFSSGIEVEDMWKEAQRLFVKEKNKTEYDKVLRQ